MTSADIFVVDDDPLVTTSLGRLLELETRHRIRTFSSPAAALDAIHLSPPDVILSDLSMPGMDGVELLRRARAVRPDAARIMLTGHADKEAAVRAVNQAGIYHFIEKPWENDALLITIENAVQHVELTRELRRTVTALEQRNAELMHVLADLRDAHQRLVDADRLAAVGRLAGGVAHEIGNQLSLLVYADLLLERYGADPTARALIEPIIAARRRLASMVGSIRDFVRGNGTDGYERAPRAVAQVVAEALDILRFDPYLKYRRLERAPWDENVHALVHADKLTQVIINLVRNALQATAEGGSVRVGVERRGDLAVVEVADDGAGIHADLLDKIWEPFFSTKGESGTGLGLGISRRILEEHGGTIRVRSQPGHGATFTVELPAVS